MGKEQIPPSASAVPSSAGAQSSKLLIGELPKFEDTPINRQTFFVKTCIELFDKAYEISMLKYFDPDSVKTTYDAYVGQGTEEMNGTHYCQYG